MLNNNRILSWTPSSWAKFNLDNILISHADSEWESLGHCGKFKWQVSPKPCRVSIAKPQRQWKKSPNVTSLKAVPGCHGLPAAQGYQFLMPALLHCESLSNDAWMCFPGLDLDFRTCLVPLSNDSLFWGMAFPPSQFMLLICLPDSPLQAAFCHFPWFCVPGL